MSERNCELSYFDQHGELIKPLPNCWKCGHTRDDHLWPGPGSEEYCIGADECDCRAYEVGCSNGFEICNNGKCPVARKGIMHCHDVIEFYVVEVVGDPIIHDIEAPIFKKAYLD